MRLFAVVAASLLTLSAIPARAGIADSPLPVLEAGKPTLHLYSVPVVGGTVLPAYFSCTSTDTAPMRVGVEFFGAAGGGPANDAVGTSLSVAPGATVLFGTLSAVWVSVDSLLGIAPSKGSARILATSKKLVCTAFLADPGNAPPTSMVHLTIVAKTKQKAAN